MNHFHHLTESRVDRPSIVTIGVFDGVHRGHQYLLAQLVTEAHTSQRTAVVLTLSPHPDRVLKSLTGRYYLTTPEQKARWLGDLGVDIVVTQPFDDAVRHIRAAAFVEQLRANLNLTSLWVTADFALGYKREGSVEFLRRLGEQQGFEVRTIDVLTSADQQRISSTMIREALWRGEVETARSLLGRSYQVEGVVIHGDHRGRTIGFPTANLQIWDEQIIPANGVYACRVQLGGETFMAVTNIGNRPTFGGDSIRIEAHLLDFEREIYGQTLRLEFVAFLRGEQKFSGIEALISQIQADAQRGRSILTTELA